MKSALREFGYALRRLRGSPGFTIAATLTLAIAIGATASVFGLVNGILLKPFPYRDMDRILSVLSSNQVLNMSRFAVSPADFIDWRAQNTAFSDLAAIEGGDATVTGTGEPERLSGRVVTPSYFPVLGVTLALGRGLTPDSAGPAEVVIGYGYWQRRFGGSSSVLGKTLTLDDKPYTIVGVMPAGLPGPAELWTRLTFTDSDLVHRDWHYLAVYGRLKPGATVAGARHEMETIAARLVATYPATNQNWSASVVPIRDQVVGPVRPALIMLLAAAACVLLIGVANLANLFLVRGLARQRELAVRTALGATRGRLVRELVAEAALLGVTAGAMGVALAVAGVRALRLLAPPTLPRLSGIGVDGRVVAFCAATSIATVFLFGVLPAWQASRGNLAGFLKEGGRGTGSARHHRLQNGLVVLQVAVALVLLTSAGLLVESFSNFRRTDPGFQPGGVLSAQVAVSTDRYPTLERETALASSVVTQLAAQPGVASASASSALPGGSGIMWAINVLGDPPLDPSHRQPVRPIYISPDYFSTMGIKLRLGRGILPTDSRGAVKIAVVDEGFAKQFFAGREAVGQRIAFVYSPSTDTVAIVGVVASVRQGGLVADDVPVIYMALDQTPLPGLFTNVAVRTSGDPRAQTAALRRAIYGVDRTVPVFDIKTMDDRVTDSVGTTRFSSFLASLFAVVALVLGIVGIYSVLAYIVSQRRREIAVRIALGANRTRVIRDVFRQALVLTAIGIALGSGTAWVLTSGLSGLLVGVNPHDPGIFIGAAAVFAVVALAAASIPALRTTRVNPVTALTST
jgi:predicted permease